MHIEINQSLQKVAANATRKYLSGEIDWVLNKMQERFIQLKLRPVNGRVVFTGEQVELNAVRELLTERYIPAYIDTGIANRYKAFLPMNYSYLVHDSSVVFDRCGLTTEPVIQNKSLYLTYLKQPYTEKPSAPYYEKVVFNLNETLALTIKDDLPLTNTYTGFNRKEDISFLTSWIEWYLNDKYYFNSLNPIQIGFENFGTKYKPQQYIIVSETSVNTAGITYDDLVETESASETLSLTQHAPGDADKTVSNRIMSSEWALRMNEVPFFKSNQRSPVSELQRNTLYIYADSNFTVNRCLITYIRKPRPMSIVLGSDCELAQEYHQTICDLAVEYIQNRINDVQGYQLTERDNSQRVIL